MSQFHFHDVKAGPEKASQRSGEVKTSGSAAAPAPRRDAVEQQRIGTWLAEWKRREVEVKAGGDLQAARVKQRARIEAQQEWMIKLTQIMQAQGTQTKRVVALRLLQALETAATDPATRPLLPADTIKMLDNVREWLKFNE